jgi:hypothetical protein
VLAKFPQSDPFGAKHKFQIPNWQAFGLSAWRNAHCKQASGENCPRLKTCFVIVFKLQQNKRLKIGAWILKFLQFLVRI